VLANFLLYYLAIPCKIALFEGEAAMPHTPATGIIILKRDGGGPVGPAMPQDRVEAYLTPVLNDNNRLANLKQSMNDISTGKGKATGSYTYNRASVWHASSGNGAKSVTLFYTMAGSTASIFAMGEHAEGNANVTKYTVSDYGQTGTDFALKKTIAI
jgi:hypothetical protein